MTSMTDIPILQLMEQMVYPERQNMVGERFRVAHLTSAKGKTLNGKICRVHGYDRTTEARLHCEILEESSETNPVMKLKNSNLVVLAASVLESYMNNSAPLSNEEIIQGLEGALQDWDGNTARTDLDHRLQLYQTLLTKLQTSKTPLSDDDYCFPCGADGNDSSSSAADDEPFAMILAQTKPACVGNKVVDVRHMDLGLKGDGTTMCSICSDVLADQQLVTLPCCHAFHDACLVQWLDSNLGQSNWNCPTCRHAVPHIVSTYSVQYATQLQNRFSEFLLSGFCPKCIIWVMERNRNEPIKGTTTQDGEGLVRGCVGQTSSKVIMEPRL